MNKGTKRLAAVLLDLVLIIIVIIAVYALLTMQLSEAMTTVLKGVIVACIPTGFLVSFLTFGVEKYENMMEEDEEE